MKLVSTYFVRCFRGASTDADLPAGVLQLIEEAMRSCRELQRLVVWRTPYHCYMKHSSERKTAIYSSIYWAAKLFLKSMMCCSRLSFTFLAQLIPFLLEHCLEACFLLLSSSPPPKKKGVHFPQPCYNSVGRAPQPCQNYKMFAAAGSIAGMAGSKTLGPPAC